MNGISERWPQIKLYEVLISDIDTRVRFKVLSVSETETLLESMEGASIDTFKRSVLEAVIMNLMTDVTSALKKIDKDSAQRVLDALYNACLMLNPALDIESWLQISNFSNAAMTAATTSTRKARTRSRVAKAAASQNKISNTKFLNLERHLKERVIGQDEAIDQIVSSLKRSQVGLHDEKRPLGVFLFAGASGVGKTLLARELHEYMFGETDIVRIDCGEFQHKHENQKLIGSPPGYIAHENGGQLTNDVLKNPDTVILLDEVEKADPDIWNTFLRVFDEGWLTDGAGKKVSFHNTIIIMTTNLGNTKIADEFQNAQIGFHSQASKEISRSRIVRMTTEAIRNYFKPELLNRIDKTVVFNHLNIDNLFKIAELELQMVQAKLEKRGYALAFDDTALEAMIRNGASHVRGARGLSQLRRESIEGLLADFILEHEPAKGTTFQLTFDAGDFQVAAQLPVVEKCSSVRRAPAK